MDYITELFCLVDDFCIEFEAKQEEVAIGHGQKSRKRASSVSFSEIMTIVILFHQSGYRFFKYYYNMTVRLFWRSEFPILPSYNRMVELLPKCLLALTALFHHIKGKCTGISIIDSTKLMVCHNKRIERNRVFKGVASRGKSSFGWFYGFKLHMIINQLGEIISVAFTSGNVHDVKMLEQLSKNIQGILLADKGYISKERAERLLKQGVKILTTNRKNMKNVPKYTSVEKQLLKRRGLIETVNDQLKNLQQIDHTRHRSIANFMVNAMAAIVAYCLSPNKPAFKNMLNFKSA